MFQRIAARASYSEYASCVTTAAAVAPDEHRIILAVRDDAER